MLWEFENDEDGLAGNPCEQWLIRDNATDNRDIVAAVPKTGDEQYDNEVTYRNVVVLTLANETMECLRELLEWGTSNTSPTDPNSPHDLLVKADELLRKIPTKS
jgi:hypothetical protein